MGAALNLAPNGTKVLRELGFDEERARCVQMMNWDTVNGITLDHIASQDVSQASARFGAPYLAVHRVDLHEELMRLAAVNQAGGVELHLSTPVLHVYPEDGRVELQDGSVEQADLIVGADGLHSVARSAVVSTTAQSSGLSAFRFLIPSAVLENDPAGQELLDWKKPGATMFVDPGSVDVAQERHLMWYPCRRQDMFHYIPLTDRKLTLASSAAAARSRTSLEFIPRYPDHSQIHLKVPVIILAHTASQFSDLTGCPRIQAPNAA